MKTSMKTITRIITVLTLALVFVTAAQAQVRVNPKVGVNLSALEAKLQDFDAETRAGWNAGVDFRVGKGLFYVSPGAHYYSFTARLIDHELNPDNVQFEEETTIQSLRIPLNVGVNILGLRAQGGLTGAYVLGVTEKNGFAFDASDLNRFTYGANVGVGIDLLFLTADLNYEIGLRDFFKEAAGENNILTLSVGLKF